MSPLTAIISTLRRFAASQRASTSVEFAMVSIPFFSLLFGVLELGLMFMTSAALETAAISVARQIRTGQIQGTANDSATGFKSLICNGITWMSTADCNANLSVDVRTFSTFASITTTAPVKNGAIDPTQLQYASGVSCNIVLVRAFYPYTLYTPLLDPGLPNLGTTQRLLTSAVAFRNENWATNGPACL